MSNQKNSTSGLNDSGPENEDKLTPAQNKMVVKLSGTYFLMGTLLSSFRPYAGVVLMDSAVIRAEEIVRACRHHKSAWSMLEKAVSGSDIMSAVIGHGALLLYISLHDRGVDNRQLRGMVYGAKSELVEDLLFGEELPGNK